MYSYNSEKNNKIKWKMSYLCELKQVNDRKNKNIERQRNRPNDCGKYILKDRNYVEYKKLKGLRPVYSSKYKKKIH